MVAFSSGLVAQHVPPDFITSQPAPPPPSRPQIQAPPPNASGTRTPDGAVRISGGVMAGQIVKKVLPETPCGPVGGAVVLHAIIGTDGKIEQLSQISGPQGAYGNAFMDAVRQWEYKPYLLNGSPVRVSTTITLDVQRNANGCPSSDH